MPEFPTDTIFHKPEDTAPLVSDRFAISELEDISCKFNGHFHETTEGSIVPDESSSIYEDLQALSHWVDSPEFRSVVNETPKSSSGKSSKKRCLDTVNTSVGVIQRLKKPKYEPLSSDFSFEHDENSKSFVSSFTNNHSLEHDGDVKIKTPMSDAFISKGYHESSLPMNGVADVVTSALFTLQNTEVDYSSVIPSNSILDINGQLPVSPYISSEWFAICSDDQHNNCDVICESFSSHATSSSTQGKRCDCGNFTPVTSFANNSDGISGHRFNCDNVTAESFTSRATSSSVGCNNCDWDNLKPFEFFSSDMSCSSVDFDNAVFSFLPSTEWLESISDGHEFHDNCNNVTSESFINYATGSSVLCSNYDCSNFKTSFESDTLCSFLELDNSAVTSLSTNTFSGCTGDNPTSVPVLETGNPGASDLKNNLQRPLEEKLLKGNRQYLFMVTLGKLDAIIYEEDHLRKWLLLRQIEKKI